MKEIDNDELLGIIINKCSTDPNFIKDVINAAVYGVTSNINYHKERAADMETMASAMTFLVGQNRVTKQLKERMSDLALSKLDKYLGKTNLNWSNVTKNEQE